jgi:hypothetical protein
LCNFMNVLNTHTGLYAVRRYTTFACGRIPIHVCLGIKSCTN